jgi:5-hydroxyisourate hydrolase
MTTITVHVLDTHSGKPAAGIALVLTQILHDKTEVTVGHSSTDASGRVKQWSLTKTEFNVAPGLYSVTFGIADYYRKRNVPCFFNDTKISFNVGTDDHYHVPLLMGPNSFTTYRGS